MDHNVIQGANWYVEEINCRKFIDSLQLPRLSKARETFVSGGGFFRMAMPNEIEELEARASLRGSHADLRSRFGNEPGDWTTWYYYERLRDIERGINRGRVVTIKGLLQEVEQPRVTAKRADTTNYVIGTIVLYKDIQDGKLIHKMDFFNNQLVINGVDYSASHNQLLAS